MDRARAARLRRCLLVAAIAQLSLLLSARAQASNQALIARADSAVIRAGLQCTVIDARAISKPAGIEVACSEGLGYVIVTAPSGEPAAYGCLEVAATAQKSPACNLPENQDQSTGVNALITQAGLGCSLDAARGIAHNAKNWYFEISCKEGVGYVLVTAAPPRFDGPIEAIPCLALQDQSNLSCKFTASAPVVAELEHYAADGPNKCAVTGYRYHGRSASGFIFEVSCADGKGYLIRRNEAGIYDAMVSCSAMPGRCVLEKKG